MWEGREEEEEAGKAELTQYFSETFSLTKLRQLFYRSRHCSLRERHWASCNTSFCAAFLQLLKSTRDDVLSPEYTTVQQDGAEDLEGGGAAAPRGSGRGGSHGWWMCVCVVVEEERR